MGHGHFFNTADTNEARIKFFLGNPKRAILHLAVPIFFSLVASGVLHLTDMIWVSGLGPDALAAVGFFVPLYIVASAIGSGLGVGAGTCIAQRIGARDRAGASRFAAHMFIVMGLAAILVVLVLLFFTRPIFSVMGAENTMCQALSYARIMMVPLVCMLFTEGAYAIFRSEGNAGRVMWVSVFGLGKSLNSLWLEIFRNILLTIPLIYLFGVSLSYGLSGIWTGMVAANLGAALAAVIWVKRTKDMVIKPVI